jgi:hypothetical protein
VIEFKKFVFLKTVDRKLTVAIGIERIENGGRTAADHKGMSVKAITETSLMSGDVIRVYVFTYADRSIFCGFNNSRRMEKRYRLVSDLC